MLDTKNGDFYNSGTIAIASGGTVDADSSFDGTNGTIIFSGEGNLLLGSTVENLGTLSTTNGTVTYDGIAVSYTHLTLPTNREV